MGYVDIIMPFALGKYYVDKHFTEDLKNEGKQMVENIREAMKQRILEIEWLEEETKTSAIKKILEMKDGIGYPDYIMEPKKLYQKYKNVEITDYLTLILSEKSFTFGNKLRFLDKNEWKMAPHVNILYIFFN